MSKNDDPKPADRGRVKPATSGPSRDALRSSTDDTFAVFSEWSGDADRLAYDRLQPRGSTTFEPKPRR